MFIASFLDIDNCVKILAKVLNVANVLHNAHTTGPHRCSTHTTQSIALMFLPPEDLQKLFNSTKTLVRSDEQLSDVYRYFEETWIDGFGVALISQHDVFRTNNCAE